MSKKKLKTYFKIKNLAKNAKLIFQLKKKKILHLKLI